MKKVTIITATHNLIKNGRKEYFTQMFDSIQSQTYKNIEHLIIDGASKDGTIELIKKLKKSAKNHEVRLISEPDTGIYNAFNKGIKNAKGDYIIFMNSDDYYCENFAIEELIKTLEKNNADFSTATVKIIDEKGNVERIVKSKPYYYSRRMPFSHNTMLCKKELFKKFGTFDESYKYAADYDFIFRVMKGGAKSSCSSKIIIHFRHIGVTKEHGIASKKEAISIAEKYIGKKFPNLRVPKFTAFIYRTKRKLKNLFN
jgi:glycosyltransferase involved in cell wall biosynthesis